MADNIILEAKEINKSFGGNHALSNVSFRLRKGEILSVMGENGAGKSTLMKIIAGAYKNDTGDIYLEGKKLALNSPLDATAAGISIVYQEPNVFADMSVLENIFMGNEISDKSGIKWNEMYAQAVEALKMVDLSEDILSVPMGRLSIGNQQLVLIARGVFRQCKILILDEPTSILSYAESEKLFQIIFDLKAKGVSILYISHRVPEILRISDDIIILRDGCVTGRMKAAEATEENVIEAMSGRKINRNIYIPRDYMKNDEILKVEGLTYGTTYKDISFTLRPGEVLGFYGLVGSGRSEMARAIFGETNAEKGTIIFENEDISHITTQQAVNRRIFYVPEDRGTQGLFAAHDVRKNMSASFLSILSNRLGVMNSKKERQAVQDNIDKYSIKVESQEDMIMMLSGGGQQKVLLCRWLLEEPKVIILDEPTRGIDVATKTEIHKYIMGLAQQGVAVILISSDLPEVMALSDEVIAMHNGVITAHFDRENATEKNILKYALNLDD
ncbi:MAG: sugar ABC transporter ATP-binding protein [Lachnospiraceae bacterium]|nr:sugar ABC transporter ATP-binding protein [Lachnospiraceae bacterium]